MASVPKRLVEHCDSHKLCKGCPLGTCVAPVNDSTDPRWQEWINDVDARLFRKESASEQQ